MRNYARVVFVVSVKPAMVSVTPFGTDCVAWWAPRLPTPALKVAGTAFNMVPATILGPTVRMKSGESEEED